jgi:hypothetical protein
MSAVDYLKLVERQSYLQRRVVSIAPAPRKLRQSVFETVRKEDEYGKCIATHPHMSHETHSVAVRRERETSVVVRVRHKMLLYGVMARRGLSLAW